MPFNAMIFNIFPCTIEGRKRYMLWEGLEITCSVEKFPSQFTETYSYEPYLNL